MKPPPALTYGTCKRRGCTKRLNRLQAKQGFCCVAHELAQIREDSMVETVERAEQRVVGGRR